MEYTYVEISGLPGSGKTTLIEYLDNKYIQYYRLQDDFYHLIKSKRGRAITFCYCFSTSFFYDLSFMFSLFKETEKYNRNKVIKKYFKLLRFKGIFKRKKENYLLSEGYVQTFLEIMDCINIDAWENRKSIKEYFINDIRNMNESYFIFLIASVDTVLMRINKRNDINNSIDRMEVEDRIKLLNKRFVNTRKLMDCVINETITNRVLVLDGNISLDENIQLFNEFIGRLSDA